MGWAGNVVQWLGAHVHGPPHAWVTGTEGGSVCTGLHSALHTQHVSPAVGAGGT